MTTHTNLVKEEESEGLKAYAKAKIASGLENIAAGRTVSAEEFLAEIKTRRHATIFR